MPDQLPEPFAPTGPKLSRLPVRPAPPIRPRLLSDEARFAARLSLLAGGTELAAWVWFARLLSHGAGWTALGWGLLRVLRPLWASAGTRVSRAGLAVTLLGIAVLAQGYALVAIGAPDSTAALAAALPAVGDLCSSCAADAITVERRPAAFSWLDVGQGLGCALGLSLGAWLPHLAPSAAAAALIVGSVGVPDLIDRGTPRSTWPTKLRLGVLRSALGSRLSLLALAAGALASAAAVRHAWKLGGVYPWLAACAPLAGMTIAARAEPAARNAVVVPGAVAALAACAAALRWTRFLPAAAGLLALAALGAAATSLPAAVARGAGEMERPVASSLAWSALALGAGLACAVAA